MKIIPVPKPNNMTNAEWIKFCEAEFDKIIEDTKDVFIRIKNSDAI